MDAATAFFFAVQPNIRNITANVPGSFNDPTAVRLRPGDSASFRIRWTNSVTDFGEAQIDNLAISGTFLDQNNEFVQINPADVVASSILLGDVNTDGMVDFLDISSFITVLSGGVFQAEADCDESGVVDFLDISSFIAILSGQ